MIAMKALLAPSLSFVVVWLLTGQAWVGFLTAYFVVGLVAAIVYLVRSLQLASKQTAWSVTIDAAKRTIKPETWLRWSLRTASQTLLLVSNCLTWPASIITLIRISRRAKLSNESELVRQLPKTEIWDSPIDPPLFTLLAIGIAYILSYSGAGGLFGVLFLSQMLLVAAGCRYAAYALTPGQLHRQIRIVGSYPPVLFLGVFCCEFLGIVLLLPITVLGLQPEQVDVTVLRKVASSLYDHREWWNILSGAGISPSVVLTNLVGVLFDFALLVGFVNALVGRKNEEDIKHIAHLQLDRGDYESVRETIKPLEDRDIDVILIEAELYLAKTEIEKAKDAARLILAYRRVEQTENTVLLMLANLAFIKRMPSAVWEALLKNGAQSGASDTHLTLVLLNAHGITKSMVPLCRALGIFDATGLCHDKVREFPVAFDVVMGMADRDTNDHSDSPRLLIREQSLFAPEGLGRLGRLVLGDILLPLGGVPLTEKHARMLVEEVRYVAERLTKADEVEAAALCLGITASARDDHPLWTVRKGLQEIYDGLRAKTRSTALLPPFNEVAAQNDAIKIIQKS